MELGLVTPVVLLNPRYHNDWERAATVDDLVAIAQAADRLGYRHLACSEHVAIPTAEQGRRGARYWDPSATLAFLAAHTERIRLATHVLVLGYHHPLQIIKRYGTVDLLSGGRLVLGVGVGSLREEFELLGRSFEDRGARADDALRVLRACFGVPEPAYEGTHFRFGGVRVEPCGLQQPPPLWIGGRTRRSLRRALELGDGWVPFGLARDELRALLDDARASEAWLARSEPFDLVLAPERPLDPIGNPTGAAAAMEAYAELGATVLNLRLVHRDLAHCLEQLEAALALVPM